MSEVVDRHLQHLRDWLDAPPTRFPFPQALKAWIEYADEKAEEEIFIRGAMRRMARVSMMSIADFMRKDMLEELGGCDPRMIDRAYALALPLALRGRAGGLYKKYLDSLDTLPYWASDEWWESSPEG